MKYLDHVNVKMGTNSVADYSNGNTLPLTAFPFGANHFTPETRTYHLVFNSNDHRINGIRLTHSFSPWLSDYNYLTFNAVIDDGHKLCVNANELPVSTYQHSTAIMTPAFCKFHMNLYNTDLALSPTSHGAVIKLNWNFEEAKDFFRIFSGENGSCEISTDNEKGILQISSKTLCHHHDSIPGDFRLYSIFKFDCKIESCVSDGKKIIVGFGKGKKDVTARLGTSFISMEQALYNLESEIGAKDIDDVRAETEAVWEKYLSKIEITAPKEQMDTFYSCMYRCFLFPRAFHERCPDGIIRHFSVLNGKICDGPLYTDHCFWDTYKTLFALYSLIDSELYKEMCQGFLNFYKESGWLPRCTAPNAVNCMPGTAVDAVFADAVAKNIITDPDTIKEILAALLNHAYNVAPNAAMGRDGIADFNELGYVSNSFNESVNKTLDYAYGNYCIAEVAKAVGDKEAEAKMLETALNYKNLFDKETGFFRAKDKTGNMRSDFTDIDWGGDYTEGSVWQNTFAVYHDLLGYAKLLGGRDSFLSKADELFAKPPIYKVYGYPHEIHEMSEMAAYPEFGQCALSNQPSFHLPYLFSCMGDRDKSAYWVRKAVKELFSATPDGFPGDEDTGSMAAWYIFSSLGFYPVCPGSAEYVLASPSVKKAVIHLDNGRDLTVRAEHFSEDKIYASTVFWKSKALSNAFVCHSDLKKGGVLRFSMSAEPSKQSYSDAQLPFSLSR